MVLFEVHQRFKGHFLNELLVSFKRDFCLSFSLLYLFIRGCNFVMIETRPHDITDDDVNAMTSLIIQSI